jgi:hypothetical protein
MPADPRLSPADPLLSASLFRASGLDPVLASLVARFSMRLRRDAGDDGYLWFSRYSLRGEHLKLRIHAPERLRGILARRLNNSARRYFRIDLAPEPGLTESPPARSPAIPIDVEDRGEGDHPDRSLLWTTYQRSPVSLGPLPLLRDDRYVGLLTRCLGAGCEQVLAAFSRQAPAGWTLPWRRQVLVALVSAGLEAVLPDEEERRAYLVYHRDWLIRLPVLRRGRGVDGAREILDRFELDARQGGREDLREAVGPQATDGGRFASWHAALVALRNYVESPDHLPVRDLDPFAEGPLFPVLFKVVQSLANALGLSPPQEGRTYHRMLRATETPAARGLPTLLPSACGLLSAPPSSLEKEDQPGPFDFEADYRWLELVAASGPAGARWVERYRALAGETWGHIQTALRNFRGRRREEGWSQLRQAEELRAALASDPSLFHVLGRFYFGVLAYAGFCGEDYQLAGGALQEALDSIRQAIETEDFLVPFAALTTDMLLKRAQVARAQCLWREMASAIADLGAVAKDRQPLCVLSGGRPIFHSTIGDFLARLPPSLPAAERAASYLSNAAMRMSQLETQAQSLYALPGFVIPYP